MRMVQKTAAIAASRTKKCARQEVSKNSRQEAACYLARPRTDGSRDTVFDDSTRSGIHHEHGQEKQVHESEEGPEPPVTGRKERKK